jgi:large subunit ribosomal protein L4
VSVQTYTKSGAKSTTAVKLDPQVFSVPVKNHDLLHKAYVAYLAESRTNAAVTKTRAAVRGGGKKPWKQKGTGRARVGSSRSPLWRGGGITFGPTGDENYSLSLNKKTRQNALRQALTIASQTGKVKAIEAIEFKDGKTRAAEELLRKVDANGSVLVVVESKTANVQRATNNMQNVTISSAQYLNVYDVLNADTIVITNKAFTALSERLGVKQ